ncbi:tetratricopeptide repeat protein [Candidatus Poribacteria bacterium]|nr:tetratricopeptide repeat protein [Candidatus Poribacteria bacterium]
MQTKTIIFPFLLVMLVVFIGCSDEEADEVPLAEKRINEGWSEYMAANYSDAVIRHQQALDTDPDAAEAYNGIGWALARLNRISEAVENFQRAIAMEPSNADAHAGLAGAYMAERDYERAIASARAALSAQSEYFSPHDDIGVTELRILLAKSYYNRGEYSEARAQVDLLRGANDLDPSSSTYLQDLASAIQEVSAKQIF